MTEEEEVKDENGLTESLSFQGTNASSNYSLALSVATENVTFAWL